MVLAHKIDWKFLKTAKTIKKKKLILRPDYSYIGGLPIEQSCSKNTKMTTAMPTTDFEILKHWPPKNERLERDWDGQLIKHTWIVWLQ